MLNHQLKELKSLLQFTLYLQSAALSGGSVRQCLLEGKLHEQNQGALEKVFARMALHLRAGASVRSTLCFAESYCQTQKPPQVYAKALFRRLALCEERGASLGVFLSVQRHFLQEKMRLLLLQRASTSQVRFQATLLSFAPLCMLLFLCATSVQRRAFYFTTSQGWMVLGVVGAFHLCGSFWMKRLIADGAGSSPKGFPMQKNASHLNLLELVWSVQVLEDLMLLLDAGLDIAQALTQVMPSESLLRAQQDFLKMKGLLRKGFSPSEAAARVLQHTHSQVLQEWLLPIVRTTRQGGDLQATFDSLRTAFSSRVQAAQEEALGKLPVKLLFPLALFFVPALLLLVGAPFLYEVSDLF
jgi:hypothetical protein